LKNFGVLSVPSRFAAFLFLRFLSTAAHPTSRSQIEERWPATVTGWRERDTTIPPSPAGQLAGCGSRESVWAGSRSSRLLKLHV